MSRRKEKCSVCGNVKKITKMVVERFESTIHPGRTNDVWTCKACLRKEKDEPPPEPEPAKRPPRETKPIRTEPWPQSIESDTVGPGYLHEKQDARFLPSGEQESGRIMLDPRQLKPHTLTMLGADLMKVFRDKTGYRCYAVKVIQIEVEYLVRHPPEEG